jgi:hypothetical protein
VALASGQANRLAFPSFHTSQLAATSKTPSCSIKILNLHHPVLHNLPGALTSCRASLIQEREDRFLFWRPCFLILVAPLASDTRS